MEVISRGSIESSIKVPTSAGPIFAGGWYIGATDMPGSGSRPLNHHRPNITAKAHSGSVRIGLLRANRAALVRGAVSCRRPLGMYTSTDSPPCIGNGWLVSKLAVEPSREARAGSDDP